MTSTTSHRPRTAAAAVRIASLALALPLSLPGTALAGPGAHGPNGEHLDTPASAAGVAGASSTVPRLEAQTETFELVGRLQADEFSLFIARFETGEPVLGAQVEVETGGLRAVAAFHADQGDYAVEAPALLAALQAPGAHPVVVTVVAGAESDLLDGTLVGAAAPAQPADGHGLPTGGALAAATAAVLAAAAAAWLAIAALRRRSNTRGDRPRLQPQPQSQSRGEPS